MAGKNKQKQQLNDPSLANSNQLSDTNLSQKSSNTNERKPKKKKSRQRSIDRSISPVPVLTKKVKIKPKSKSDNCDTLPSGRSIDSDTGSHFSKRRRRETHSSVSEQISEPPSTSSNVVTKSRRRRTVLPQSEDLVTTTTSMASPSSHNQQQTSDSNPDPSKSCLPSTSRGKHSIVQSKSKSKFPQFSLSSSRDPSIILPAPEGTDNHGIVSSGMDISHFQNYLSSRSLTSPEIGDQINRKLEELRSAANDKTQEYVLMSEINQHLLVSYEDSLNFLRVADLVSQVVVIIQNCEENLVDLKNICYNVLLHLMEALPRSSDYLVSSLSMFLDKISNMFDFDSLEQIINVIERVSRRHGHAVLQSGAFTIILNYYDFLTAPQQLTILNMISQCFSNLRSSDFNYIVDGIENLSNRLKQSEPKCVEKVIQCFVRLVNAYQADESKLKKLVSNNLFANLQDLLISSPPVISSIHDIVQMLAVLCANCPDLAVDIIRQNISQTILCICNSVPGDLAKNRSGEEVLALVNLISELMPPLPLNDHLFIVNRLIGGSASLRKSRSQIASSNHDHAWYWFNNSSNQWISHPQNVSHQLEKALIAGEYEINCHSNGSNIDVNLITMEQSHLFNGSLTVSDMKRSRQNHSKHQKNSTMDSRQQLLLEQCQKFEIGSDSLEMIELMRQMVPLLMELYGEASNPQVRYKCLEALLRTMCHCTTTVIDSILHDKAALSSLMASLLASHDSAVLISSIQIGTVINFKLPKSLILNFKKEGVLYQLNKMLTSWRSKVCSIVPPQSSSSSSSSSSSVSRNISLDPLHQHYYQGEYASLASLQQHHNRSDIVRPAGDEPLPATTTQRFTNWIMKRGGCVGRPATSDISDLQHNATVSRTRKTKFEAEQALDMSVRSPTEQAAPSSNVSSNRRINQIMGLLNMNSSLSNPYSSGENKTDKTGYDNPKKEVLCKQWILKFGTKLDSDWRQVGDEASNERMSSISSFDGQKKDVLFYLKEIANGLRSECSTSINQALTLYAELLATDCYISVFEMESSLINEAMLDFFTKLPHKDSKRENLLTFLEIFCKTSFDHQTTNTVPKSPFLLLISHLLMCLHQQEQFHVRTSQLPSATNRSTDSASSRTNFQSRFALTQVFRDAILGGMSSGRRNVDSLMFDSSLLPNLFLEPQLLRTSGNRGTEALCTFTPYVPETHSTDAENGFVAWNGGDLINFTSRFNVTLDVLGTVSGMEKIVMRELSRRQRINKRLGLMPKEMASLNDSSDSDEDYDCDGMNASLLSGEIDYQDDASDFADLSVKKHFSAPSQSSSKSANKKSRAKQKTATNTLVKIRDSGLKGITSSKRIPRQLKNDSESLTVTPSTSSGCSSSVTHIGAPGTTQGAMKPISKMQILIGDVILSPEMTLYQAIRRYSSHVTSFIENYRDGKTDQEIEEAINQIIWKSQHNIYYRPVSSTNHLEPSFRYHRFGTSDSVSTFNFMSSLLNPHSQKIPHISSELARPIETPSVNTRQRSFHRKLAQPQTVPDVEQQQPVAAQPMKYKRRRKNNAESIPSIGRSDPKSCEMLFSNLTKGLPYPTLIDFPTIFEPISLSKTLPRSSNSNNSSSACDIGTREPFKLHHDLTSNMPTKLETTLALLRCLYFINRNSHVLNPRLNYSNTLISEMEFRSQKLSSKANRQLQDTFYVLARNIPFWCIQLFHTCAFLFPLETRQNFLYLFNFDRARTLLYLEGSANQDPDSLLDASSDIRRMRVQVNRSDRLLEESELLLKNHGDPRTLLEISFNNEAGFGLGPTNEFYTQVSRCLMRADLHLWYSNSDSADSAHVLPPPSGLYPRPRRGKKLDTKLRNKFVFLGRFMARALLDCRKIDLPLSPVFYKWLLGREDAIDSADLAHVDPRLAAQLQSLHGVDVEELQIVFVHPIYLEVELVRDGGNRIVQTAADLALYVDLVASTTLVDGVRDQMEAVLEGFGSLLPGARGHLAALFEPEELEEVFCGGRSEDNQCWDVKTLNECCVCDHGYTMTSRSIVNLFEIMAEFTREQRRHFVQFCTGTPRLPVGGFRALRPPFKIVNKRECGGGESPDLYLPSVMTCQNFLKLPDYSSKAVMLRRLLYALHEGQNAFFLS